MTYNLISLFTVSIVKKCNKNWHRTIHSFEGKKINEQQHLLNYCWDFKFPFNEKWMWRVKLVWKKDEKEEEKTSKKPPRDVGQGLNKIYVAHCYVWILYPVSSTKTSAENVSAFMWEWKSIKTHWCGIYASSLTFI